MKTKEEIREKVASLTADERHNQPSALVEVNAPLALIQVAIENRLAALLWVLDEDEEPES